MRLNTTSNPTSAWRSNRSLGLALGCTLATLAAGCGDDAIGTRDAGMDADVPDMDAGGGAGGMAGTGGTGGMAGTGGTGGSGGSAGMDAGMDAMAADAGVTRDAAMDGAMPDGTIDAEVDAGPALHTVQLDVGPGGSVEISGAASETCPASQSCEVTVPEGSMLTLTPMPDTDYGFDAWGGDCSGSHDPLEMTIDTGRACTASFLGTAGEIGLVEPPPTVVPNETEDDQQIVIFAERTSRVLQQALPCDFHVSGRHTAFPDYACEIPAGAEVNVYFLHYDLIGTNQNQNRSATLTFPREVLGLIVNHDRLGTTDPLVGHPEVTYPDASSTEPRGLEMTGQDEFTLQADRRTLEIDFRTSTSSDQMRIVTVGPGVLPVKVASVNTTVDASPTSVVPGDTEDTDGFLVVGEEKGHALEAELATGLDATPGEYTTSGDLTGGTLAASTRVDSYLVHFDPEGTTLSNRYGSITFERPILGILLESGKLDATDTELGAASVSYPASGSAGARGFEIDSDDRITIGEDGRSLHFRMSAQNSADQLRVLVQP